MSIPRLTRSLFRLKASGRGLATLAAAKPKRQRRWPLIVGTTVAIGGVGFAYRYNTDEGTRRQMTFWKSVAPIYAHYRYIQYTTAHLSDDEADREFNKLHDKYAPVVEELVFRMRGFYLKMAQVISTLDSFVPDQYMHFCKKTQDEVPTEFAPGEARKLIERSLGKPIEEIFSEFDEKPCGSASIGQVHRARLRSNGQEVAVKVQAVGIERKFRADIKTVMDFTQLAMPQHIEPMKEIEEQFATEFDYVGEARNLQEVYDNIMPHFADKVVVPKPIMHLCTKDVLVMEFLQGKSLLKGVKDFFSDYAASQGKTYDEIAEEQLELIKSGKFEFKDADEEAKLMKRYQRIMDAQVSGINALKTAYNYTLGLALPRLDYTERKVLLNLAEIVKTVAYIHGYEIMVNGAFNGDPHPGNILLLDDGRLGLIDYGQVKRIPHESRIDYAHLIKALADDDKDEVVNIAHRCGYDSKYNNPDVIYRITKFWHDSNSKDVTNGLNPQLFIDWCEEQDPVKSMPVDFIMPGRVSVLLRGVGNAFGIDLKMANLWRDLADKVLAQENNERSQSIQSRRPSLKRRYSSLVHRKTSFNR